MLPVNSVTVKESIACVPQTHAPRGSTSSSSPPPTGSITPKTPVRAPDHGALKGTHVLPMESIVATSEPSGASARRDSDTPLLHVQEEDNLTLTRVPGASA